MQFVNGTDDPITLEPGEGVTGTTQVNAVEGEPYRLTLIGRPVVQPAEELLSARDILDADLGGDA